jgi:hypothetical protein
MTLVNQKPGRLTPGFFILKDHLLNVKVYFRKENFTDGSNLLSILELFYL